MTEHDGTTQRNNFISEHHTHIKKLPYK